MTNPTTPFSWQMPTSSDLVTDLPADFETFGQAVATSMADLLGGTTGQILSKASNTDMDFTWITNDGGDITAVTAGTGISGGGTSGAVTVTNSMATAITASGDLIQGTGSGTFARLGTGTNGQYLTTNGTTLSWGTLASSKNYTLLNSGGTSLSGSTTTISGISGKDEIYVVVSGASSGNTNAGMALRINTDTAANYFQQGVFFNVSSSYAVGMISAYNDTAATLLEMGRTSTDQASAVSGTALILGANSSGVKPILLNGMGTPVAGNGHRGTASGGLWNNSATVTSISINCNSGSFDAGTVYVYTTA